MKKTLILTLFCAITAFSGELILEKDFIRFASYGRFSLLPSHGGLISILEEDSNRATFYFDMETRHHARFFTQTSTTLAKPVFAQTGRNTWQSKALIPANDSEAIRLTMTTEITPLNNLDIHYTWTLPRHQEDILSKGLTLNYQALHLHKPAVIISGQTYELPNDDAQGLLVMNAPFPDLILFPGNRMETKIALDGNYTIHYASKKNRVVIMRIIYLGKDNHLRFTLTPKNET